MVIRSACHANAPALRGGASLWIIGCGLFGSGLAAHAAAQAGYPAPPPAQPQQPYAQPSPVQPQPVYQQPAPQPAPPAAPPGYPQPQPAPFGAQPQPAAPAPGYPAPPAQYSPFPVPPPDNMQAPPSGIPNGAFQLGLSTTFVRYEPLHAEVDNNGGERDTSFLKWGLAENPVVLELGYGFTDRLVFGGTLGLGGSSTTYSTPGTADADDSKFMFEFGPKLDFMFSPGSKVNPFIGALVLVHLESSTDPAGTDDSTTAFLFLARVGLRAFLTDSFSIDPALVAGGGFGSGSVDQGGASVDYSVSGFRIGLNIGFSGWML
jgi:opacity protein-like surface antigen